MGVSFKLAINYLKNNKKRTIIMISSLLITTMLITCILLISNSYKVLLVSNDRREENWEIKFEDITFEEAKIIEKRSNIKEISIIYKYIDKFIKVDNKNINTFYKFDANALKNLLSSKLIEGRLPEKSNEVLIKENSLEDFKIGDKFTIKDNDNTREYTVVGIMENTSILHVDISNQIIGYLDRDELTEDSKVTVTVLTKNVNYVYDDYYDIYYALNSYKNNSDISLANKTKYNTMLLEHEGVLEYNSVFSNTFYSTEGVLIAVILIVAAIFIYSITNIGIVERKRYFGILNSIGATTKQMRKSLKVELFIILGIAIPVGVVLGILITYIFVAIVNSQIPNLIDSFYIIESLFKTNDSLKVAIPFSYLFISVVILILVTYIATALTIRKVGRIKPIRLIKDNKERVKIKKKHNNRQIPIERKLAYKNIERYKVRYAAIIMSLTISIILIIVANYYISTHMRLDNKPNYNYQVSISYFEDEHPNLVENIITDIKNENIAKNIKATSATMATMIVTEENISDEEKEYSPLLYEGDFSEYVHYHKIYNAEPETYCLFLSLLILNDEIYNKYLDSLGVDKLENNECIFVDYLNEKTKYYNGIRLTNFKEGDSIRVGNGTPRAGDLEGIKENFKIAKVTDVLPEGLPNNEFNYGNGIYLIVNQNGINYMLDSLYGSNDYDYKYYTISLNANSIDEMDNFFNSLKEKYNLEENNVSYINRITNENEGNQVIMIIKLFVYAFIGIITLVGILNIYNAINSSLEVRRKEIISLITLGMEEKQINKMIFYENILCGFISLILGVLLGTFISYLIYFLTVNYRWYSFVMPWNSLIISLALIVIITIFFSFYLKKRLFSGNLVEILKRED